MVHSAFWLWFHKWCRYSKVCGATQQAILNAKQSISGICELWNRTEKNETCQWGCDLHLAICHTESWDVLLWTQNHAYVHKIYLKWSSTKRALGRCVLLADARWPQKVRLVPIHKQSYWTVRPQAFSLPSQIYFLMLYIADPFSNYFITSFVSLLCSICSTSAFMKKKKLFSIWKSMFLVTSLLMEIFISLESNAKLMKNLDESVQQCKGN